MDKQGTFLDSTDNSFPACTTLNLQRAVSTEGSVRALQKATWQNSDSVQINEVMISY